MVRAKDIEQYHVDGVVCLRQVVSPEWIDVLRAGVQRNIDEPGDRARLWNRAPDGSETFYDSQSWQRIPEYERFIRESPMAAIAGQLMKSESVNFYFDAIFCRTQGSQFRTPFHQDEPYWSVDGFDACSAWMPLMPVDKRSCLEFVRGSHATGVRYAQVDFGDMVDDDRNRVQYDEGFEPFPDVEGDRASHDIMSWDMEPGDVAVFNARMIHGGSGLLDDDRDLRVFNTQWLGDDARVCFRPTGMDPDHSEAMTALGLAPGDRVSGDLYPELWRRS